MLRKIIFWSHLVAGLIAGLVILMMSFTGVLITYEYQMIEDGDMRLLAVPQHSEGQVMAFEEIMASAGEALEKDIHSVVVRNVENAPYQVSYDRRGASYVDPYTGEVLGVGNQTVRNFMAPIRSWHRWFNVDGDGRNTARAITGACNVIFLFILISGFYLWFPKVWKLVTFRIRLWFKKGPNSKFRDFNWHHVFGFWSLIPLIAIVVTATAFSYPSVRAFVNEATADSESESSPVETVLISASEGLQPMGLNTLVAVARRELGDDWYKISASPAADASSPVELRISLEKSMAPYKQVTWSLNPYTGEVLSKSGWAEMSTQGKANQIIRRLHTGEFYGFIGQTIAGIVSLFACIMVYTGFALAWRRLISPLFKTSKKAG